MLNTYDNLVNAASGVISYPETTPTFDNNWKTCILKINHSKEWDHMAWPLVINNHCRILTSRLKPFDIARVSLLSELLPTYYTSIWQSLNVKHFRNHQELKLLPESKWCPGCNQDAILHLGWVLILLLENLRSARRLQDRSKAFSAFIFVLSLMI